MVWFEPQWTALVELSTQAAPAYAALWPMPVRISPCYGLKSPSVSTFAPVSWISTSAAASASVLARTIVIAAADEIAELRRAGQRRLADPAEALVAGHGAVGVDAGEVDDVLAGREVGDHVARGAGRAVGDGVEVPAVAVRQ